MNDERHPAITAERHRERLEAARGALAGRAADGALLCGPGPDLEWLVGYDVHPTERLTMLILTADSEPLLVVPRLELEIARRAAAVAGGAVAVRSWEETEEPLELVGEALPRRGARTLFVSDDLPARALLRIERAFPAAGRELASLLLRPLRAQKQADEVELLRRAARAADRVVEALIRGRLVGRSERDLAREVRARLVDEGHEEADFWTVAGGANSAAPHHSDSDRPIRAGEPLLFDIGGRLGGYCSDITRTVWVAGEAATGPDEEFRRLYAVVERAHAAGLAAVRPGVACAAVDAAARSVIEAEGLGDRFLHRTGHGIGLEVHEHPYLVAGNEEPLRVGHVFSVEPGIYLEGRYGARIEDIVACGADGPDVLNEAPRELLVVRG